MLLEVDTEVLINPALKRLKQKDHKFEDSLD